MGNKILFEFSNATRSRELSLIQSVSIFKEINSIEDKNLHVRSLKEEEASY